MIPFNKPYLTGKETDYIYQAVNAGNRVDLYRKQQLFRLTTNQDSAIIRKNLVERSELHAESFLRRQPKVCSRSAYLIMDRYRSAQTFVCAVFLFTRFRLKRYELKK